jgi:hypothetical protein
MINASSSCVIRMCIFLEKFGHGLLPLVGKDDVR